VRAGGTDVGRMVVIVMSPFIRGFGCLGRKV
jgi:hypothetical protein